MLPCLPVTLYCVQVQVPEEYKKHIQRFYHGAAAVTVNSDCVEVILFGGQKELLGSLIADSVVVRFGECIRVLGMEVIRMTVDYILLI